MDNFSEILYPRYIAARKVVKSVLYIANILLLPFLISETGCTKKDTRYVAVEGKATVRVPVEYFSVRISITTEGSTFTQANDENRAMVRKVFAVFRKFAIADSDFVTKTSETSESALPYRWSLGPEREKRKPAVEYSGTLILRNPGIYDVLFKELVRLGKVEVGVFDFGCDSSGIYRAMAYKAAVAKARHQAEFLLEGTGRIPGKLIKVLQDGRDRYGEYDDIPSIGGNASARMAYCMAAPQPSTFRKKYFEVNASVTMIYEME